MSDIIPITDEQVVVQCKMQWFLYETITVIKVTFCEKTNTPRYIWKAGISANSAIVESEKLYANLQHPSFEWWLRMTQALATIEIHSANENTEECILV